MPMSRSKIFSIIIYATTVLITGYAIYKGLDGVASAVFSTGVTASTGLYVNKQYQLRKEKELNNK